MTDLIVRRLLIDLQTPFAGRWNGGDAFRSAFFNALSMSFPAGEQYFIDSVRDGLKALPDDKRAALAAEVQGFIGQQATHRRIHTLFNLETEVGRARVGCDGVRWQGARTLRASARKDKQRRQRAPARLNRVRSVVTLEVTLPVRTKASVHKAYPAE